MMFHIYKLLQEEVQKFFSITASDMRIITQQIPTLPRTLLLDFHDFPGPGNFTNTIPGLSSWRGNPVI